MVQNFVLDGTFDATVHIHTGGTCSALCFVLQCDPSGCIVDLFIQLLVVMVGKQFINNCKELLIP